MTATKTKKLFFTVLFCAFSMYFSSVAYSDGTTDCKNVQTDKGKVTGTADDKNKVCTYLGIPYAAPPVGKLRFARPLEHDPWYEALAADDPKAECVQFPMSLMPSKKVTGSEDCLYLNVWSPSGAAPKSKPVMVFIHGGGYVYGSKNWPLYNGVKLSSKGDVIVVTINYRLGALGFLVHPALRDKEGYVGNYAMHDQIAALKWVKKNIMNFGGDPNNVTVFGESAGGISVGMLLASSMTKDLFQKAIIESGPISLFYDTEEHLAKQGESIAKILGCDDPATAAECLRAMPAERFLQDIPVNVNPVSDYETGLKFMFEPSVDGKFLKDAPEKLFASGDFLTYVPVIIGTNADEASYFTINAKIDSPEDLAATFKQNAEAASKFLGINIDPVEFASKYPASDYKNTKAIYNAIVRDVAFTCPSRYVAKLISKYQPNTYVYLFAKAPQESGMLGDWGAFHGVELAFVYGNFEFMGIKFASKANTAVSDKVIAYWSNFTRLGSPDAKGLPEWRAFNAAENNYLLINKEISEQKNFQKEPCDLFDTYLENSTR